MIVDVRERRLPVPADRVGALLDGLASDADVLWASDRWPRMRFDGGLVVGAVGGHGPVGYRVVEHLPARRVAFRFLGSRPRGLTGWHGFDVIADGDGAVLRHTLTGRARGWMRLAWPLVWRPLHDALIDDALDRGERAVTGRAPSRPARWSWWVRVLRRLAPRT